METRKSRTGFGLANLVGQDFGGRGKSLTQFQNQIVQLARSPDPGSFGGV